MNIKNHLIIFIQKTIISILPLLAISPYALATLSAEAQQEGDKGIILYNQSAWTSAQPHLRAAAEAGDPKAQYYLGEALRLDNMYMTSEARRWYEAAAHQGDLYAMMRLSSKSDMCRTIGTCNKTSGDEWEKLAKKTALNRAEKGNTEAMIVLYEMGESLSWLQRAAAQGNHEAQHFLAVVYEKGKGWFFIPGSRHKAVEHWAKASAEGGNVRGMFFYADFLFKNDRPTSEVGYWLKKTAEAGHIESIGGYALNVAHLPDAYDYPLNLIESYGLMYLLSNLRGGGSGPRNGQRFLSMIAEKMTPEEIQRAIAYSKEWEKNHPPLSYYPPVYGY